MPVKKAKSPKNVAKSVQELSTIVDDEGLQLWQVSITSVTTVLARSEKEARAVAKEFAPTIAEDCKNMRFAVNPLPQDATVDHGEVAWYPENMGPLFEVEDEFGGLLGPSIGEWIKAGAAKEWKR